MKEYLEKNTKGGGEEYYYPNLISKLKAKDLRIGALAEEIGINYYGLSRKINGKVKFSGDEANKICKILGETYDYLFFSPYKKDKEC